MCDRCIIAADGDGDQMQTATRLHEQPTVLAKKPSAGRLKCLDGERVVLFVAWIPARTAGWVSLRLRQPRGGWAGGWADVLGTSGTIQADIYYKHRK